MVGKCLRHNHLRVATRCSIVCAGGQVNIAGQLGNENGELMPWGPSCAIRFGAKNDIRILTEFEWKGSRGDK